MANLGNAWHIPTNPEPRGTGGMLDPVGGLVPDTAVTILSGNQFQGGGGNPGNQLGDGSAVFVRRQAAPDWTMLPMTFRSAVDNNKYFAAEIPADVLAEGEVVEYYLRIPYDDHDTTFLHLAGGQSATTGDESVAQGAPYSFAVESSAVRGRWGPVFALPNVAVHAHLLFTGEVLFWGRRDTPDLGLDEHFCTPHVWDPATGAITATPQPRSAAGTINLFCSGHTQLADGRVLVVGGHIKDSEGLSQTCTYQPGPTPGGTWTASADMGNGRWYPSAVTLSSGAALVLSGSFSSTPDGPTETNFDTQVWSDGRLASTAAALPDESMQGLPFELYPRVHVASNGQVVMTGSLATTWSLNLAGAGTWAQIASHATGQRDYCPSVLYDTDKIIYIGGGNAEAGGAPSAEVDLLDLTAIPPRWEQATAMQFPRRQHNGTLLPDGTVLVTGGTRGGDGIGPDSTRFNNLAAGQPVHVAELWDPATNRWTELAAESVDRCYHSTALLLPDATVLSAGGGEYRPGQPGTDPNDPNDPQDSHRDAQIFSPPYLFKGPQPEITTAPEAVDYGATFAVDTPDAADIGKVSWVRLGSVTHSFNVNQRINFLAFEVDGAALKVTAPASEALCPPGHYMLFIVSKEGVPSVARIVQIGADVAVQAAAAAAAAPPIAAAPLDAAARQAAVVAAATGTAVVVGVTSTCPYGLGACWGGAHEALLSLAGVQAVDPIPDADDSTATVFLTDDGLPALDQWGAEFTKIVNGRYELRGVEVTISGPVEAQGGGLVIAAAGSRPQVALGPITAADKVQLSRPTEGPAPLAPDEADAFDRLGAEVRANPGGRQATVTGPLTQLDSGYRLEVRWFTV
jgi:galactose oxidase